jgi:hypothetical protein
MSNNQDPLAVLENIIGNQERVEPVKDDSAIQKNQESPTQAEIEAQEKRIAELKVKEAAVLAEDEVKIAQTREEFSEVISDSAAQQTEVQDETLDQTNKEETHPITQLKRLD